MLLLDFISRSGRAVARGVLALSIVIPAIAVSAELPQYAPEKHMGPATCASSVCHGRTLPNPDGVVLQDEYRTWSKHDRHARAYQTLLNDDSKRIARNLGLKNAHEAKECLDCHADNVPTDRRGAKFFISDGVGCEACHGGAEKWLINHADSNVDHQQNLRAGMFPTDNIVARAELCLSCHQGTDKKFATHRIMGAGHPRLSFELDTFTIREPEHYRVDDDYLKRKTHETTVNRWAIGALVAAGQTAKLLNGPLFLDNPLHPEISLFDCHSCHQSMNDLNWGSRPLTAAAGPGIVRINDSSLIIAAALLSQIDSKVGDQLTNLIKQLHSASARDRKSVVAVSKNIDSLLQKNRDMVLKHRFSPTDVDGILNAILALGIRGEFRDYAGAEQAVMAVDVLSYSSGIPNRAIEEKLARLYEILRDDDRYPPNKLAQEFKVLRTVVLKR